jgi:branched-chain amino acid transport system ATP-binding protein
MLEVSGLKVAYGGIQAVKGVSFHVDEGEMVALIGANGAGKTSVMKAVARMLTQGVAGSVLYRGAELTRLAPHQVIAAGVALVPEGRGVFQRLTIQENLVMGAYSRRDQAQISRDIDHVYGLFPRLKEREQQLAGTMSGGEQQMLAIGRALMSKAKILLLDEPSMGLAPIMVQKIFDVVQMVRREGMTVLLVEQNAKLALEVSDRGYVMEHGEITLADEARALLANPAVRQAYLGE